jgi:hypothetical protein
MSAGVWMVPITLASLALLLWAAARLEGLLAPRASDTELSGLDSAASGVARTLADSDSLLLGSSPPPGGIAVPGTGEESQSYMSE